MPVVSTAVDFPPEATAKNHAYKREQT